MKHENKKKHYLVSPYVFSLSAIGLVGMLVCYSLTFYFLMPILANKTLVDWMHGWFWACLFIVIPLIIYVIACIIDSFDFWGFAKICCGDVVVYAPFRKKVYLSYNEIKHIGIEFVYINGKRQYWVYMSKNAVFPKYLKKINKMPITSQQIRIQYSESVCADLLSVLPLYLKKQLKTSISSLPLGQKHMR